MLLIDYITHVTNQHQKFITFLVFATLNISFSNIVIVYTTII